MARLTSIESDKQWYERVKQSLADKGIDNVELLYAPLVTSEACSREQQYVNIAARLPEHSLNFALVDGKLRDRCVEIAMRLLKPGGILVVDNVERYIPKNPRSRAPESRAPEDGYASEQWKEFVRATKNWRCIWTTNGVWDTALWIKAHP